MSYIYVPEFKVSPQGLAYMDVQEHRVPKGQKNLPIQGLLSGARRALASGLALSLTCFPVRSTSGGPIESRLSVSSPPVSGPVTPGMQPGKNQDTIDGKTEALLWTPSDASRVITPEEYKLLAQPNDQQVLLYGSGAPIWRRLIPTAAFSSITDSSGSRDFLGDVEAAERAQAAEISAGFGVGPIVINDFRREARQGKLWTPGFGLLFDWGKNLEGIFEFSYGKGHVDTDVHFDETHVLGLPFNTGTLDANLRIKRESLGAGLGLNFYPLGKVEANEGIKGIAYPYLIFVIGPQYMHFNADGKLDFSGTDAPFPIPSSRTIINQQGSDLGFYTSFGAGIKFRPPEKWAWGRDHFSMDCTARFNQYESLGDVSSKFDQWTWGFALVYEFGGGKKPQDSGATIEGKTKPWMQNATNVIPWKR